MGTSRCNYGNFFILMVRDHWGETAIFEMEHFFSLSSIRPCPRLGLVIYTVWKFPPEGNFTDNNCWSVCNQRFSVVVLSASALLSILLFLVWLFWLHLYTRNIAKNKTVCVTTVSKTTTGIHILLHASSSLAAFSLHLQLHVNVLVKGSGVVE